jgi:beta-glucosidase
MHELKQFERVEIAPGETRHVSLQLDARAFAYYDVAEKGWKIDPGAFMISVGDSLTSLPLASPYEVSAGAAAGAKF